MKKAIILSVVFLSLAALAQDGAAPSSQPIIALPLPQSWSSNAIVVLCVNFVLAVTSILSSKVPGAAGKILRSILDLFTGNPKH
jgi:hypothetical protein